MTPSIRRLPHDASDPLLTFGRLRACPLQELWMQDHLGHDPQLPATPSDARIVVSDTLCISSTDALIEGTMICHRQVVIASLSAALGLALLLLASPDLHAQDTSPAAQCGVFAKVAAKATASPPLPTLVVQAGHTREAHVTSIAFTPDSRYALTGTQDGTAILWELRSGLQIRRLGGHMGYVLSVAISEDGQFAVTAVVDGAVHLWKLDSGTEVMVLRAAGEMYTRVAFADGGASIVAATQGGALCRWRRSDGSAVDRFDAVPNPSALATSKEGVWMAAGAPPGYPQPTRTIKLWHPGSRGTPFEVPHYCTAAAFNSKENAVACGGQDGATRLFDAANGTLQKTFTGHAQAIVGVAAGPEDAWIASASASGIRVWNATSGTERLHITPPDGAKLTALAVTPDGSTILGGDSNGITYLWDPTSGRPAGQLRGRVAWIRSLALSKDKKTLYAGDAAGTVHLWDLEEGAHTHHLKIGSTVVHGIEADPLGTALLASLDDEATLIRLDNDARVRAFKRPEKDLAIWTSAFSQKGDAIAVGYGDGSIRVFGRQSGKLLHTYKGDGHGLYSLYFISGDRFLISGGQKDTITRTYPAGRPTGHEPVREVVETQRAGRMQVTQRWSILNSSGSAISETLGRIVRGSHQVVEVFPARVGGRSNAFEGNLEGHAAAVAAVAFSPNSRIIATGSQDRTTRLWSSETGKLLHVLEGHDDWVMALAFLSDKVLVTASDDGTVRLWDVESGSELVRLIAFNDGEWAVVDGRGYFHTSSPDAIPGLHWVFPNSFKTLPPELFMKDFYEPRLLPGKLSGASIERNVTLQGVNIAQPEIEIAGITPSAGKPGAVDVSVKVRSAPSQNLGPGGREGSGVYDVRLFRDGSLVGRNPGSAITADTVNSIASWRKERQVLAGLGETALTFKGINLPGSGSNRPIEFSAYAFNEDRVRSAVARTQYTPASVPNRTATAYVVSVGVNAFDRQKLDLAFADDDARAFASLLPRSLRATRQFHSVVPVTLISDWKMRSGARHVTERATTKANIKAVFDLLAGRPVANPVLKQHPGAAQLKAAGPNDLVIFTISTHGYSEDGQEFYLIPYDFETTEKGEFRLETAISGQELSEWIEGIDAREMVLIIDACQSAAIVEGAGFRPGPLGGRGIGQLAYDRGLKVLASARALDLAWESGKIHQGLTSFALIQEGLLARRADATPRDGQIEIREWLAYPVSAVPRLFEEVILGKRKGIEVIPIARARDKARNEATDAKRPQRPTLFDFRQRTSQPPMLVSGR